MQSYHRARYMPIGSLVTCFTQHPPHPVPTLPDYARASALRLWADSSRYFSIEILMPLPKLPSKPATILPAKDYPQATAQRPVSAIAAAAAAVVEDVAVPAAARAPKKAAPVVKAVPTPKVAPVAPVAAPVAKAPAKTTKSKAVAAVLKAAPAVLKAAAEAVPAPAPVAKLAPVPTPAAAPAVAKPVAKTKAAPSRSKVTPITAEAPHPAKHKINEVAIKSSTSRHADQTGTTKLFVLDTNVLMHDPSSLFRFEEHDVYLPMMTLEELDNHKKGMTCLLYTSPSPRDS